MSEYYKIIDTSILRSGRAILFQRLLPKLGSQAHFNTMCFSFAAKMAADTNQLKEIREYLRAGNEDSAKRLIQTLNPSSVVDVGKDLKTALSPFLFPPSRRLVRAMWLCRERKALRKASRK